MNAHTLVVRIDKPGHDLPLFLGGRAAVLLRMQQPEGSKKRYWIDPGPSKLILPDVMILEMICPNSVGINSIITAVNRAVKELIPELSAMDWTTSHFSTTACINQDI